MSLLKQVYMHARSKNMLVFSENRFNFTSYLNESLTTVQRISLSKPFLSVSPHCCDWSDGAVLCDWSTVYTACRKRNANCLDRMTALETCQYIEKIVWIVAYQLETDSDDETVEVVD